MNLVSDLFGCSANFLAQKWWNALCPLRASLVLHFSAPSNAQLIDLEAENLHNHIDRNTVGPSTWNNDIGMLLGWHDIVVKVRLDKSLPLIEHRIDIPTSVNKIPTNASHETSVIVGVHENLHMHQVDHVLRIKDEDALYNNNICSKNSITLFQSGVSFEVVDWNLYGSSALQLPKSFGKEFVVECIRMIEIVLCTVSLLLLLLSQTLVERILRKDNNLLVVESFNDFATHGGLPRCRTSTNSDYKCLFLSFGFLVVHFQLAEFEVEVLVHRFVRCFSI
mmetsp:Transcript_3966/g.14992  ORF Transcript_3966/g.14992 Transcript_3966/m.14992 type:complete len:279 (+) Transcript_3966:134-970(+)